MKIIRLGNTQKKCIRVDHPLLNGSELMDEEDFLLSRDLFLQSEGGAKAGARERIIMGHISPIGTIVGRFLAGWSETTRFEEDMVSEGLAAVVMCVDNLKIGTTHHKFRSAVWSKIVNNIETMLNDSRSMFSASQSTNYRRVENGEEPEYNYTQEIREELDAGVMDDQMEFIDMLDELESLGKEDRESFRAIILRCMETEQGLNEEDLTDEEIEQINNLAKMLGEL